MGNDRAHVGLDPGTAARIRAGNAEDAAPLWWC